jgi:hypothetical protein
MFPYKDLPRALAALDRRDTRYQFDIEKDVPWSSAADPGLYLPRDLIRDIGFDAGVLASETGAWEMFQWASALLYCENFVVAEREILDFMEANASLMNQRSNALLCEEEIKHIELFRRCAEIIRQSRPEWVFAFDEAFERTRSGLEGVELLLRIDDPTVRHLTFWMGVIFFEEVTVYLNKRLSVSAEVQPFWKAVHRAHMREEVQHLLTDTVHLNAIEARDSDWKIAARLLLEALHRDFGRAFGFRVALEMVSEAFPRLKFNPGVAVTDTAVYADISRNHSLFRRTRACLQGRAPDIISGERK